MSKWYVKSFSFVKVKYKQWKKKWHNFLKFSNIVNFLRDLTNGFLQSKAFRGDNCCKKIFFGDNSIVDKF